MGYLKKSSDMSQLHKFCVARCVGQKAEGSKAEGTKPCWAAMAVTLELDERDLYCSSAVLVEIGRSRDVFWR